MSKDIENKKEAGENNAEINRRSYLKMMGVGAGASAGSVGWTSFGVQSARAHQESPCHRIDSFEDGDLSEYTFGRGSSGASVVTSPTYSGSYALEISGTNTEMFSMDGLEHYPAAGDVFGTWVRGTNNADRLNFTYGVQNHRNRYFARINPEQGRIALYRYENGSSTLLADKGVALSQDTWYEIEIRWKDDGTHIYTLFDDSGGQVSQISATDSTWKAGGVGYDAYLGDGGTAYFDHVEVKAGKAVRRFNSVVDSFEDEDLKEYTFDQGSSGASVVSNPTYGGSSVLEIGGTNTEMVSTSGLNHYPTAGDVFSYWVRPTDGASSTGVANITYGVQDHENRYYVQLDFEDNRLGLVKLENGSSTFLEGTGSVSYSDDTWYNVEVKWQNNGRHIVTLYDCTGAQVSQITGTDATWQSGGVGYDAYVNSGETVYFDYITIHKSILDNFEDGDLAEYNGDTSGFTVQSSTVLEGDKTLEATNSPSTIAHTDVNTPRGNEYETTVKIESGSDSKPAIVGCIQDSASPLKDCYYVSIDPVNDTLSLYRRDDGKTTLLEESSVTVDEGTQYRLVLQLTPSLVVGILRDAEGNDLEAAGEHDRTYHNGNLGLHVDGGTPSYFDLLIKRPRTGFIDTFRDGDIAEYSGDTSAYTVQSSTVLAGSQTLKAENVYMGIAHTSRKTLRGNGYKCTVQPGNSDSRPGLLTCVQDPADPINDCYWVQASPDNNNLNLFRRDAGSTTVLDRVDVTIEKGTTYQLAVELRDEELKAKLHSENGIVLAETETVTDTTYDSGQIGFYTGGSSAPAYYDNLLEVPLTINEKHIVNASQSNAESALNETLTEEVLNELNNPSTSPSDATRENVYRNNKAYEGTVIKIPMEYGKLLVIYRNGSAELVRASLDRSTMSSSLIDDLSDSFGWPSSEEGALINHEHDNPHFMRSVTDSERSDIKGLVTDHDGRTDEPGEMMVMNNDGGWYRSTYYNKVFDVNGAIDTVVNEDEVIHSPDECDVSRAGCALGGVGFSIATKSAALSCGSIILTGGGSAPACGVSVAGVGASGAGMAVSCYGAEISCPDS